MGIHSNILIHWTGREDRNVCPPEYLTQQGYIDRLIDYYTNGLYMKRTEEKSLRNVLVKRLLRICFSELRLSQIETHAEQYGKLGIGFSRDFIINKGARPVIYVPFESDEISLEESLKAAGDALRVDTTLRSHGIYLLSFIKRMSDGKCGHNMYENYDEMEWRLVYDENPDNKNYEPGKAADTADLRFPFKAEDVRILIFPDEDTKQMAMAKYIKECYSESNYMPSLVTLDDCRDF